jgi:hypothetical protein
MFPYLTEIFYLDEPVPGLNNEPYYDGLKWGNDADQGSDLAAYYSRVALYGSVLSGGLAGHVYGADHIWRGNSEMPGAFLIQSAAQIPYIYDFLFSEGTEYQYLRPVRELLEPNQTPNEDNNMGWAYCMRTETKELFMIYFEEGCPIPLLNSANPSSDYGLQWFEPSTGQWVQQEKIQSDQDGKIVLPDFPDGSAVSIKDWALKLKKVILP